MTAEEKENPEFLNDPLFQELLAEGEAIQNRFAAEPVFGPTGKGFLKSVGVKELAELKNSKRKTADGEN